MKAVLAFSIRAYHFRRLSGERKFRAILLTAVLLLWGCFASESLAQVFNVDTVVGIGPGTLYYAIQQADAFGNGATINFQTTSAQINLDVQLPDITVGMTINGGPFNTVSGQNLNRIFFVNAPGQTVQINGLTLANGLARGGNGNSGGGAGGGGAGLGGAVFVNAGNVAFSSVTFQNNSAIGGSGGDATIGGGGGGGGMAFSGGAGYFNGSFVGGGGGGGARTSSGVNGANNGTGNGGNGGGANGAAGGLGGSEDARGLSASVPDGGGGGGGLDLSGLNFNFPIPNGGNGSDFGGGGGGGSSVNNAAGTGGNGGFGGGGGGGADAGIGGIAGDGGNGGFGGGGGGGGGTSNQIFSGPSLGGTNSAAGGRGGDGNQGAGGGGAALGAAVFVRSGATITFTNSSTDVGALTGGAGGISALGGSHNGTAGGAAGGALFLMGGTATFNVSPGGTQTIAGTIAESSPTSVIVTGGGSLVFSGNNTYSGGTTVNDGTLFTTSNGTLGSGPLTVNAATSITSTMNVGNNQTVSALSGTVSGTGSARVNVLSGASLTINQSGNTVFGGSVALASGASIGTGGALVKSASGTLEIDGGLSLGDNSSLAVNGGTLRLSVNSGSASVGSGVTVNISNSGALELAGSVSALGTMPPVNRVAITNGSNAAAGLLVSTGNQQVGGIDGLGNTQVSAGASLTADHIVQSALIIGGTSGNPGLVMIDASDASGNPLGYSSGLALAGSLTPNDPFGANGISSANLSANKDTDLVVQPPSNSATSGNSLSVPEPSTLVLLLVGLIGLVGKRINA